MSARERPAEGDSLLIRCFKFAFRLFLGLAALLFFVWLLLARPFVLVLSREKPPETADTARLRSMVAKLTRDFHPRDWTHPEHLDEMSDYIKEEFLRTSGRVRFQPYRVGGVEFRNVISGYGPSRPGAPKIIVGAHYDAAGEYPGADDNASSVAGLLELARMFSNHPPFINVELVAFTLEESTPFGMTAMGSKIHAESVKRSKENVRLMISLEMIGYFKEQAGTQSYPLSALSLLYPSRGNFIGIVSSLTLSPATVALKKAFLENTSLDAYSINAPRSIPGVDSSDHVNYWELGIDALMVTDTAFYRNPNYHTGEDTADTLDYEKMAQVVDGVYAYLLKQRE